VVGAGARRDAEVHRGGVELEEAAAGFQMVGDELPTVAASWPKKVVSVSSLWQLFVGMYLARWSSIAQEDDGVDGA
jgi:hypothetical protein